MYTESRCQLNYINHLNIFVGILLDYTAKQN